MNLQRIYLRVVAQTEYQTHVVRTHIAVAAADLPRLHQVAGHGADARAQAIPIARSSNGLNRQIVIRIAAIIAQQGAVRSGRVRDEYIHVPSLSQSPNTAP